MWGGLSWLVAVEPSSGNPFIDFLVQSGSSGILAFVVIAFLKGWIVSGKELSRLREERDRALAIVYRQAELTQRALDLANLHGERTGPK